MIARSEWRIGTCSTCEGAWASVPVCVVLRVPCGVCKCGGFVQSGRASVGDSLPAVHAQPKQMKLLILNDFRAFLSQ